MSRAFIGILVGLVALVGAMAMPPLLAQAPGQIPADVAKARSLIAEKKYAEAETILEGFIKQNPRAPGALLSLGMARQGQEKWDLAIEAYEKAAEFPAIRPTALYNVACVLSLRNETEAAFTKLKAAVDAGFEDRELLKTDADLANLRKAKSIDGLIPPILKGQDLFTEPIKIIHALDGEGTNHQFGWVLARIGDIDEDGVTDFATTAIGYRGASGKVYAYSGKTGKELFSHVGKPASILGNGAAGVGDVNADGTPDLAVCGPGGKGFVEVLSGKDGSTITYIEGDDTTSAFGSKICGVGDINRDGHDDFVVTAMRAKGKADQSGACYGYSGKDGKRLFQIDGEETGDQFGSGASCNREAKGRLLAVGAQDAGPGNRGQVYVYSLDGGSPVLKFTVKPDENSTDLGQMFLSFPGDANGDGVKDLFCSDFNYVTEGRATGRILLISGHDGSVIRTIVGQVPGEGLGTSNSDAGDVDGDGVGDLIVGAWQNAQGARSGGRTYLYSGKTGKTLTQWTCKQAGDTFGFDAIGIGDVNGDGRVDFAVTSAWSNIKGSKTGRVFVIAGQDYGKS